MGRAIMLQGTGSDVGKSLLVAGICRAARRKGLSVAPFKPQNMSNNAAVTPQGGEIGRAQALQARAAGTEPHTDMNPVLLKPESETGSQIIVQGKVFATARAKDYAALKPRLRPYVLNSFQRLKDTYDLVIAEGAGSPAEVNLREGDIANMGFARAADVPVVLCADINRGGVIAQVIGTKAVLEPGDRAMISGFVINKFRGDPRLFDDGYAYICNHTGWRGFGVLPWFDDAWKLPPEDAFDIKVPARNGGLHIVCLRLARIANFDDITPLGLEPNVRLTMLGAGEPLPADADVVLIPGSKSTRGDLAFLKQQGWDIDIAAHIRRGGHVLGLCGGFQMLGKSVADPDGLEGPSGTDAGLGYLDVDTVMKKDKRVTQVSACHRETGALVEGYEIHLGDTTGVDCARPFSMIGDRADGAVSQNGRIAGTYLHGIFDNDSFRRTWLAGFDVTAQSSFSLTVDTTLDALAEHLAAHCDLDALYDAAR